MFSDYPQSCVVSVSDSFHWKKARIRLVTSFRIIQWCYFSWQNTVMSLWVCNTTVVIMLCDVTMTLWCHFAAVMSFMFCDVTLAGRMLWCPHKLQLPASCASWPGLCSVEQWPACDTVCTASSDCPHHTLLPPHIQVQCDPPPRTTNTVQ